MHAFKLAKIHFYSYSLKFIGLVFNFRFYEKRIWGKVSYFQSSFNETCFFLYFSVSFKENFPGDKWELVVCQFTGCRSI